MFLQVFELAKSTSQALEKGARKGSRIRRTFREEWKKEEYGFLGAKYFNKVVHCSSSVVGKISKGSCRVSVESFRFHGLVSTMGYVFEHCVLIAEQYFDSPHATLSSVH